MKLRRIFAAVAACAVAATMAVSASANGTFTGNLGLGDAVLHGDDGKDYPVVTDGVENWAFDLKVLNQLGMADDIDLSAIYGFSVTFKEFDLADGAGGAMVKNAQSDNWNAVNWGNEEADNIAVVLDDKFTLTRVDDEPFFAASDYDPEGDGWAQFALQSWWGPNPEVVSLSILGKDGAVMKTYPLAEDPAPAPTPDPEPTPDPAPSNPSTGSTAGLALAGLALAGVAVVATKKSK